MGQQEREIQMDHTPTREVVIDIDCNESMNGEAASPDLLDSKPGKISSAEACNSAVNLDGLLRVENGVSLSSNLKTPVSEKNVRKEKCKSHGAKKPPKPPRPPRGLSLDAADQKMIKEIAELAMIKRARIERMKALKKMKAAKASSTSSSSRNFIAMLLTILFCILFIFQGMPHGSSSDVGFHGSPETNAGPESGFIAVHNHQNILTPSISSIGSGSPNLVELASGSDIKEKENRDVK